MKSFFSFESKSPEEQKPLDSNPCKIDFETFSKIVRTLDEQKSKADAYLDKLVEPFGTALVDNPLVESLYKAQDQMMQALLGEVLAEDLSYFLTEKREGAWVEVNGTRFTIDTVDAYLNYAKRFYF